VDAWFRLTWCLRSRMTGRWWWIMTAPAGIVARKNAAGARTA
jgi:hypothetical protein